ncbi:MAG: GIY-YIG nuclease family protein [bacterium]|nr:GIY-YIG nuclease family protein [bacterium]
MSLWYVYIAKARTGFYYTGITTNVLERVIKHNNGKGLQMGKQQGPFVLVYESSSFPNKSEARKREAQIKGWSRLKKNKLINRELL